MKLKSLAALSGLMILLVFGSLFYTSCEKEEDPCETLFCKHGGVCEAKACICPLPYEGPTCDSLSRAKFLGRWRNTYERCSQTGNHSSYDIEIYANQNDPSKIYIKNIGKYNNAVVEARLTAQNDFVIPDQPYDGGSRLSGSGFYISKQLTINYIFSLGATIDNCDGSSFNKL